ncbi:MAG: SDR family NAD(P)-dependent oxidoreductase [Pseudomonadota bacterium]
MTEPKWTVITGSTGGIGRELATLLAERGASLILVNRSEAKAERQHAALVEKHPALTVARVTADFMDTEQINSAVGEIYALPGRIDALYNNAGLLTGDKQLSAQGLESHFAVNTLAPYLLIRQLRKKMARPSDAPAGMIVNFSSSAVTRLKSLELETLANPESVGGLMTTYAQSKLAVTTLAAALANELKEEGLLIRAIDPGATKTAMTTGGNSGMPKLLSWLAPLLFSPADKQAAKVVAGADPLAFSGRSGIFVASAREKPMPAPSMDPQNQRDLIALLDEFV